MIKKYCIILIIFFICFITVFFLFFKQRNFYKVIKINSNNEFVIDFNKNNIVEENEIIHLTGINIFDKKNIYSKKFLQKYNLNYLDCIKLSDLTTEYLNKNLLNQTVEYKHLGLNNGRIYINKQDLNILLLTQGLALVNEFSFEYRKYLLYENLYLLKNNIIKNKNNYYILDIKTKKFHSIECPYSKNIKEYKIVSSIKENAPICLFCLRNQNLQHNNNIDSFHLENFKFYILDFKNVFKPSKSYTTQAGLELINLINEAKDSIDIAIYIFYSQPKLLEALEKAQNRGIKIRILLNEPIEKRYFNDFFKIKKKFPHMKQALTKNNRGIMHNKYAIIDKKIVITGSANFSPTDLSGFNSNFILVINSKEIANQYLRAFEKIYNNQEIKLIPLPFFINKNTRITTYFPPYNNVIENEIITKIRQAKKSIYIPIFFITHKKIASALCEAKKKNIDIKIIIDATSAWNKYSQHKNLRNCNIDVKVENLAGKMHMKAIIIDKKTVILGSMNLSKNGELYNDENMIVIENSIFAKYFSSYFLELWHFIDENWLKNTPLPESIDSIGSCHDGIDNDYDNLIDKDDTSCQTTYTKSF